MIPRPCNGPHIHVTSLAANHDEVKYTQNNEQDDKKSDGFSETALFRVELGNFRFRGFGVGPYSAFKLLMLSVLSVRATVFLMMFLADWMDDGGRWQRGP